MRIVAFLFFILCFTCTVYAQDSKPSKEETIEYIQSYFKDFETYVEGKYLGFSNYNFSLSGNKLFFFHDKHYLGYQKRIYEIDLSQIEAIGTLKSISSGECQYSISLNVANKKELIHYSDGAINKKKTYVI